MCARAYTTTTGNLPTIDVRLNTKIKAISQQYVHKQVTASRVLESTEAMRAVSLSARAYAVT